MSKDEYKVQMKDARTGRRSFTLTNAKSEAEARKKAEEYHAEGNRYGNRAKVITSVEKTGRAY